MRRRPDARRRSSRRAGLPGPSIARAPAITAAHPSHGANVHHVVACRVVAPRQPLQPERARSAEIHAEPDRPRSPRSPADSDAPPGSRPTENLRAARADRPGNVAAISRNPKIQRPYRVESARGMPPSRSLASGRAGVGRRRKPGLRQGWFCADRTTLKNFRSKSRLKWNPARESVRLSPGGRRARYGTGRRSRPRLRRGKTIPRSGDQNGD